jgi:hypothetical protein
MVPDRITSVPAVGADPLSVRLYQALLHTDLLGDVPDVYKNDPSLKQYASQMRKEISDGFDRNAAMQISKQPLYGSLSGLNGRLFLAGGKNLDITRDMLSQLFRKYSIRKDIAEKILAQIK